MSNECVVVTGGAGFIGSAFARLLMRETDYRVVVLDKLTYAGTVSSLAPVSSDPRFRFVLGDICDTQAVCALLDECRPDFIVHLAAESHVDRSIDGPRDFIQTNIVGTFSMLQASLEYWRGVPPGKRDKFRFHHVSTDEVFGHLGPTGLFIEDTPYDPRSPYSASKASSDHLVRAWHNTYGLPVVVSNCSNNFGPYQFPEKLIPLTILNALEGRPLPVYGDGSNIRDWLYVDDHARALLALLQRGRIGDTYNVGASSEQQNIDVVRSICALLDELAPDAARRHYGRLITFVEDRPGHDARYAIDASKINREVGWKACESFESALRNTVSWYLDNREWWQPIRSNTYRGERLGAAVS